jgi:hypothetical protein
MTERKVVRLALRLRERAQNVRRMAEERAAELERKATAWEAALEAVARGREDE